MRRAVRISTPLLLLLALAAFGGQKEQVTGADPADSRADDDADPDADVADVADDDSDDAVANAGRATDAAPLTKSRARSSRKGCPAGMARVDDFCIDRFEAPNARGVKPLVMQSATDAEDWCEHRHKRLCTEDEWIGACEGAEKRAYPYGESHEDGRCTDDRQWRQVDEAVLAKWPADEAKDHTKDLYQATPSGTKRGCVSRKGIFDLTGNVEEWVTRTQAHANNYDHILIGCYWSGCYGGGKPTCHSTNAAHGPDFRFYETGFRCCKDAAHAQARR
jgi:formylglycine-generating enzyme required for sulfatase activity